MPGRRPVPRLCLAGTRTTVGRVQGIPGPPVARPVVGRACGYNRSLQVWQNVSSRRPDMATLFQNVPLRAALEQHLRECNLPSQRPEGPRRQGGEAGPPGCRTSPRTVLGPDLPISAGRSRPLAGPGGGWPDINAAAAGVRGRSSPGGASGLRARCIRTRHPGQRARRPVLRVEFPPPGGGCHMGQSRPSP